MLPHAVHPTILARKDAGAEIQALRPTDLSALWQRPFTSHQGARRKGRSSGLFLPQPRLDEKQTGLSRGKPERDGCGANSRPSPNSLQVGKTLLYLWRSTQTDRDAPHPTYSETEQQTGSDRF